MTDEPSLPLRCDPPNTGRPERVTDAMRAEAAKIIADRLVTNGLFFDDNPVELAADIVAATRDNPAMDGYVMARELDRHHGWMPDADTVETLSNFWIECVIVLDAAQKVWDAENPAVKS